MRHRLRRLSPLALYALWTLLVLYPNPALLAHSIPQSLNPRVQPDAVKMWADELPDDPAYIEQQVLDKYVPYSVPWRTRGVPWYFPTPREVVAQGSGDCQARMVVLASILAAKGIPYTIEASFDHIWVQYPQKQSSFMENKRIAMMSNDGAGMKLRIPQNYDWRESWRIEKEYYWDFMPPSRKLLLFGGLGTIFFRRRIARGVQRLHGLYHPFYKPL